MRASLSPSELGALLAATIRELRWGLRGVSRELAHWQARARAAPCPALRACALTAITEKRGNVNGAALFWTIPRMRVARLQRLLVAYDMVADFLDNVTEVEPRSAVVGGCHDHFALVRALDPASATNSADLAHAAHAALGRRPHDRTSGADDGGYLRTLVEACRSGCRALPSYGCVRALAVRAATLAQVLDLNHERDPRRRDVALKQWARRCFGGTCSVRWFELAAGASGWLTILALLALAAEPGIDNGRAAGTYTAYLPWISLAGTMLDSYVDQVEDAASGDHSYVAHYTSLEHAVARIRELVSRASREARRLEDGSRHTVIAACMIAMYLSKSTPGRAHSRSVTRSLARAGGPLVRLLLPVLRAWRMAYGQRSS